MYRERTVRSKWERQRVINPERWLSGLRRSLGKRVYVYSVPRVRIPPSPPLSMLYSGAAPVQLGVFIHMRAGHTKKQ